MEDPSQQLERSRGSASEMRSARKQACGDGWAPADKSYNSRNTPGVRSCDGFEFLGLWLRAALASTFRSSHGWMNDKSRRMVYRMMIF